MKLMTKAAKKQKPTLEEEEYNDNYSDGDNNNIDSDVDFDDDEAELASPDDERVVEHAAALEIVEQGGRRLVGVLALPLEGLRQAEVMVPAHVEELDEPHPLLGKPPREQTVEGVTSRAMDIGAVGVESRRGVTP